MGQAVTRHGMILNEFHPLFHIGVKSWFVVKLWPFGSISHNTFQIFNAHYRAAAASSGYPFA